MSKIFEALYRGHSELPESILSELSAPAGDSAADRAPAEAAPSDAAAGAEPAAHTGAEPAAHPGAEPAAHPGAAVPPPPPPHGIPTLSLRVEANSPLLPFDDDQWDAGEQYRLLRTKIVQHPKQARVIVISSAGAQDGKTVTAINVAGALSLNIESDVLLIDADCRRSTIHVQLGIPDRAGLAEVLEGTCQLQDALVRAEQLPKLYVLPAGGPRINPAELLDCPRWPRLMAACRKSFRYIILDSPPVAAVADYHLIEALCDGVILVARPDHTNRRQCLEALQTVSREKFLGVVLNRVKKTFLARYSGSYYAPQPN